MHAIALLYLDQVARQGSIRRAAGVLNVASSAVNRQILKLEGDLGTMLFERVGNGVRLTAAGEQVVRHARTTMTEWQEVRRSVASLGGDLHGEVKVLTIPSAMLRLIPGAIRRTALQHPSVSYRVIDSSPTATVEELRSGRPDIAVLFVDQRHRGYEIRARFRMRLGAVMRSDHALAMRSEVSLTECAAHPVVMLNEPWLLNVAAEAEFPRSGAQFASVVTTNSLQLTKEAIRAGLGIGFFTPLGFIDELASRDFTHVPLSDPALSASDIGLLVHRERGANPAVQALLRELLIQFDVLESDVAACTCPKRGDVPSLPTT